MITVSLVKARDVAHQLRRDARAAEFAPLDIQATVPALSVQAEVARQAVRDKYAVMQEQIDAAQTVEEMKALLPQRG